MSISVWKERIFQTICNLHPQLEEEIWMIFQWISSVAVNILEQHENMLQIVQQSNIIWSVKTVLIMHEVLLIKKSKFRTFRSTYIQISELYIEDASFSTGIPVSSQVAFACNPNLDDPVSLVMVQGYQRMDLACHGQARRWSITACAIGQFLSAARDLLRRGRGLTAYRE